MKDIPFKRIIRYALAVFVCLFIAANFLSNEARAEITTGNIIVSNDYIKMYTPAEGSTTPLATPNFTHFFVDSTDYNILYTIQYKPRTGGSFTFPNDYNSTTFSCLSGCTGSGNVWYDKNNSFVKWLSSDGLTITSTSFILSYNVNIFNGFDVSDSWETPAATTAANPVKIGANFGGVPTYTQSHNYTVDISQSFTDTYVYTKNTTVWNLAITKNNTVSTKYFIYNNANTLLSQEATFNKVNISYSNDTFNGVYVNTTTQAGGYKITVIDTTGSPTTPNNPADNTVNGIGLAWEFNTYAIDTTGNLSWIKTTPALACDNIKIYNEADELKAIILNPNDNGFFKIMLDREGTWKAEYNRQVLCFLSTEEILNTAYTNVPAPESSYLVINSTTIAGKQENVTYRSGRISPFNPYLAVLNAEGQPEGKFSISGYAINVEGTSPVVITTSGQHTIRICDAFGCDTAVAVTNTVFNTSIPTMNISQSNITMDNTVYSFEDTAIITYAIDNYNFSNKAIIINSYNWNYDVEQTRFVGFSNQTGSVQELLSLFLGKYVYTGLYSMRLVGRNESGDFILAYRNFTITDIDAEGYMLKMSKNKLCLGESNIFVVQSPTTSTLNITLNTNGNVFNSYYINMNKTISYKPSSAGTYSVLLYSPEGYTKRSYTFDVSVCVTPTPTPGATQGAQQAKAMANMLMSNVFWSFIITAGLMIAIAWRTKHGMATVAIGALSMTVFAAVGWFPLWAFFSIVIIAALLLSAKWASNFFDIGSGD